MCVIVLIALKTHEAIDVDLKYTKLSGIRTPTGLVHTVSPPRLMATLTLGWRDFNVEMLCVCPNLHGSCHLWGKKKCSQLQRRG